MEEMFPETVEQCLEFKEFIKSHGLMTLVADGESGRQAQFYEPYIEAQAIDVCQADMRQFGIDGIMAIADSCSKKNTLIAPHNWGSLMGYYMQLQIGRAIGNFYRAEHDPLSTDVIAAEGYSIEDGYATVSTAPGFGLKVNEDKFASKAKVRFDLKA
jgi:L-alanine-DL-glutamate epimerase-like enolase superfamily enzyme